MANDAFKVKKKLNLEPGTTATSDQGDVRVESSDGSLRWHNGSTEKTVLDSSTGTTGPGSSTDNAVTRFDGTTGKLLQNSGVTIDDSNNMVVPGNLRSDGTVIDLADGTTVSVGTTNSATTVDLGTGNGGNTINIGSGSGANTINIGGATSTVNITGTVNNQNVTNLNVSDKLVTINDGGAAASGGAAGMEVEENAVITGYVKTSADRNSWEIKAPNTNGVASLTPGASADTVTLNAASQTLTNKTINGSNNTITNVSLTTGVTGTLPDDNGGTGQSTYTTGDTLYASATNTLSKLGIGSANQVLKVSGGVPTWAAAPSGGVNYISANPAAEADTTGWTTYADAAATSPVDGTGGSPTATWTRTTSSPLRDTASFLLTKDAANRQGEGVGYAFTIDAADKAKVLQISFEYAIASGTFADDDVSVWVYDVTNATLIQPAPYKLKNHALAAERFGCEFQTSSASTSYRLIIHVASTSASAYTLKFDNFSVGPQSKLYGSPITDWVSFTPTGSWSTNTTYTGRWRRVGDSMEVQTYIALSGAPTSTTLSVNLPSGYTIDTTRLASGTGSYSSLGITAINDNGTGAAGGSVGYATTTSVYPLYFDVTRAVQSESLQVINATQPQTFANNDYITVQYQVPISGWSSSVIMSSDADTRVVAAQYYVSASTGNSSFADDVAEIVDFDTKAIDTHNAVTTGASWKFTAPVKGIYRVFSTLRWANATNLSDSDLILYKNGAQYLGALARVDSGSMGYDFRGSQILELNAGDYIQIYASQNDSAAGARSINTSNRVYVTIEKLSGPAQIAASETVAARYESNATPTYTDATETTVDYEDRVFDTHGAITTGASWKFTAPISGKYQVQASISAASSAWTANDKISMFLRKNGATRMSTMGVWISQASFTEYLPVVGMSTVNLIAGEYIDIRVQIDRGSNTSQLGNATLNWVDIYRIGN